MSETSNEQAVARKRHTLGIILLGSLVVCVLAFVAWGIWRAAYPPKPPLQGQMEARVISVSSRVPGRVQEILVQEGDQVNAEQPLVRMSLPDLEARLAQAEAEEKAARAREDLVDEGTRPQEKELARAEWDRASAAADLALKTWNRIAALYHDGLVSRQRYDEARADMTATASAAQAARDQYEIALIGARDQEKAAASDVTSEATAGVREVQSLVENRELTAPRAGEIDRVVLVAGEMAGAGFPIVTLVDLASQWATFNIREDQMPGIVMGGVLNARVPAIARDKIPFRIYYISPRASYATWRSTRENSGYDMKTFEVRARPVEAVEGLRPGMSVLVEQDELVAQ